MSFELTEDDVRGIARDRVPPKTMVKWIFGKISLVPSVAVLTTIMISEEWQFVIPVCVAGFIWVMVAISHFERFLRYQEELLLEQWRNQDKVSGDTGDK